MRLAMTLHIMKPYLRRINKRAIMNSDSVLASGPKVQIVARVPIKEAPWPGSVADQAQAQAHIENKCIINLSNCLVAPS